MTGLSRRDHLAGRHACGVCTSPRPSFPKTMFAAALRPASFAARAALRPARTAAVRAISSTAARRSDVPTPQIYGEGAKPGQVPTDENQSTGLERLQVLGAIEGVEVFDSKPLDSSRIGTLADPVKVFSTVRSLRLSPRPFCTSSTPALLLCRRNPSASLGAPAPRPNLTTSFG